MHPCNAKRKIFLASFLVNKITKKQVCIHSIWGLHGVVLWLVKYEVVSSSLDPQ